MDRLYSLLIERDFKDAIQLAQAAKEAFPELGKDQATSKEGQKSKEKKKRKASNKEKDSEKEENDDDEMDEDKEEQDDEEKESDEKEEESSVDTFTCLKNIFFGKFNILSSWKSQ